MTKRFDENRQAAKQEVNTLSDTAKEQYEKGEITEAQYQAKRENYKNLGLLIDTVASGLSAPTSSGLGIATATLSPAASYEIGQYFKAQASKNANGQLTSGQEAAHILAHTVLGAAVAAAGGNNALTAGLSALLSVWQAQHWALQRVMSQLQYKVGRLRRMRWRIINIKSFMPVMIKNSVF